MQHVDEHVGNTGKGKLRTGCTAVRNTGVPLGKIPVDPFAKVATELQNGDRIFIETDEVPQPGSYDGGGRGWLVRIG